MSARRSLRSGSKSRKSFQRTALSKLQKLLRNLKVESLEDRRMMAVGPQLAGILPDDGHLLSANETLNVAPLDLTFRFDENTQLDFSTITGIQVWRSGLDDKFSPATVSSDFGTNGAVEVAFSAKALGVSENGLTVTVTKSNHLLADLPTVSVTGRNVRIDLNTNPLRLSTALDVITAVNAHPVASTLMKAAITSPPATQFTNVSTPVISYSPLTLTGANAASTDSDLDTANQVKLRFTSPTAGEAGNGTQVVFTKVNLPAGTLPIVTVTNTPTGIPGKTLSTVTVQLNNTTGSKSRVSDVINAINRSPAASAVVTVVAVSGNVNLDVATPIANGKTLVLSGSNDIQIDPGFRGRGDADREAILRFKETLPDDKYHIDIFGSGALTLKNRTGDAFNNGVNLQREFDLDLGAQVTAVVPQPVDRVGTALVHRRNQIDVYFNKDDLFATAVTTGQFGANDPTVVRPAFYQLIFTRDTVQNTDDVVFNPTTISYDPALDKATLSFATNLDQLPTGAGTYRLRIGSNEALPLVPAAQVITDLNTNGAVKIQLDSPLSGASVNGIAINITKSNLGVGVAPNVTVAGSTINIELNSTPGGETKAGEFIAALNGTTAAAALVKATLLTAVSTGTVDITSPTPNGSTLVVNSRSVATVSSDLNTGGLVTLKFDAVSPGEAGSGLTFTFSKSNLGPGVQPNVRVFGKRIHIVLNSSTGSHTTAQQLVDAINGDAIARTLVRVSITSGGGAVDIANPNITYSPLVMTFNGGQGSSFEKAADLGVLTQQSLIVSSAIDPEVFTINYPGDTQEPGHRDINVPGEGHLTDGSADKVAGITTQKYNFQSIYGFAGGNPLYNAITENQKQRAREIFEIISHKAGIQFIETANEGFTIVTGDMRAVAPLILTGPGYPYSISGGTATTTAAIMENAEAWDDSYGGTWFQRAFHEILLLLGLENSFDLPPGSLQGNDGPTPTTNPLTNVNSSQVNTTGLEFDNVIEPVFPGDADVTHLQYVFRPESKDIDLYQFTIDKPGVFTAETIAERRQNASQLNTALRLYREVDVLDANGTVTGKKKEVVAQNDDYFSQDSYISISVEPGKYWLGVSASGNTSYDPTIEDTGIGGTSQGEYDLRLNLKPTATTTIVDATGVSLDGDADGKPGGTYNFWFRALAPANVLFVDKAAASSGNGNINTPFNNLNTALGFAQPGQIVRIVGNGGADNNLTTIADAIPYEIGFNSLGSPLLDGSSMEVPKGVTVMIDAGAVFKLRRAEIGVGSSSASVDRSASALQVLGTPHLNAYFTSYDDSAIGRDTNPDTAPPTSGSWGGLAFRRDVDRSDQTRFDYEELGIFLNYVNHADIRYGGGNVVVDSLPQTVNSINLVDSRATITYNTITFGADAAMSATPNTFEETNYNAPRYQRVPYTSDYTRVGPDIHGNRLVDDKGINGNSINGLAIRIDTPAGGTLRTMTVAGRFDDRDIVHVISETLVVAGTPGGNFQENNTLSLSLVTLNRLIGGGLIKQGTYNYRMTFVDAAGNEAAPSTSTSNVTVNNNDRVFLNGLLTIPNNSNFVARRIYRSSAGPNSPYTLVAQINGTDTFYTDFGLSLGATLDETPRLRARLDARLAIDPAIVVKLAAGGITTSMGGQIIAEGLPGLETVFTSLSDDRYGIGGTFQTRNDGVSNTEIVAIDSNAPKRGDWTGIAASPYSSLSLDNVVIAFGGGVSRVEGTFAGFNAVEIHQSTARIANSLLEYNENGLGGQAPTGRFGRGFNESSTIFVRGSQPVIANNIVRRNSGPVISINVNSLNSTNLIDPGRATGNTARFQQFQDNVGPLVQENHFIGNTINGMVVRGETLTTESVWDDTDIVHVLQDSVYINDFHTYGGIRLQSSPRESLVVKLLSQDKLATNPNLPDTAGFITNGRPLEINDRIGGIFQLVGQPGYPVVLTSLNDCTVGAGTTPVGRPANDTLGTGACDPTNVEELVGNSGAVVIDGGDRDDHGNSTPGPDGVLGTADDINLDGWQFIQQMMEFANRGARNGAQQDVLVIGVTAGSQASDAINSVTTVLGLNQTVVTGAQIDTVNFNNYKIIYVPSDSNTFGGITQADLDRLALRKSEVQAFINSGGSVVALTEEASLFAGTVPYAWLQLPLPFQIADYFAVNPLRKTPEAIAAGFTITDAELSLGVPVHNEFIGPPGFNGLQPFVKDTGLDGIPGNSDDAIITLGLASGSFGIGVTGVGPGDWRGVQIQQFAHDRNVAISSENEPPNVPAPGRNANPTTAEFLGTLAPNEKAGDENRRLGFTIHGAITAPNDIDVYSFRAEAGTEVWLDIDRTTQALDTVVELLEANGNIQAQSDNSLDESAGKSSVYAATGIKAFGMQKTAPFAGQDRWSINPRDAGMRVILPGAQGVTNTYFVRVRSSNLKSGDSRANLLDSSKTLSGLTSGAYQLQLRLRETDEIAGSSVNFGDIRYAQIGVELQGQPGHSPLLGESAESTAGNNSLATAQALGNLLTSDRGAISVAGNLTTFDDVDWYRLDVDYQELEASFLGNLGVTFDIDYADGLARPNTVLSVFDSTGRLLYFSNNSGIADDRPGPLNGANIDDLTRGSVGANDPYIGSVNVRTGNATDTRGSTGPYFIAVSSNARLPQVFGNALTRFEPLNSLVRIAEDHIEVNPDQPIVPYSTAAAPITPKLLDANSEVPYNLGDLKLFVSYDNNTNAGRSSLLAVNPFTGQVTTFVNNNGLPGNDFYPVDVGDIAMRGDGRLYAFSLDNEPTGATIPRDAFSGNLYNINTGTGNATLIGDDGIITNELDAAGKVVVSHQINPPNGPRVGWGVQFQATSFVPAGATNIPGEQLLAVGSRGDSNAGINNGVNLKRNLLYWFTNDVNSGTNLGVAQPVVAADRIAGAGTNAAEVGRILTGAQIIAPDATVPLVTSANNWDQANSITDKLAFDINDGLATYTFEFDSGPEISQNINIALAGSVIRDGNFFTLDPNSDPLSVNDESIFQFDTGPVINVIAGANNIAIGQSFAVNSLNGTTTTFEFISQNVNQGKPLVATNVPIDITNPADNSVAVAGRIAASIAGVGGLAVQSFAVGNRVTLIGERTVQLSNGLGGSMFVEGDNGRAVILQAVPGNQPGLIGSRFSFFTPGMGNVTYEFTNVLATVPGSALANGNRAVVVAANYTTEQVAQAIQAGINGSGRPLTTQLVRNGANPNYGRVVVNGQLVTYAQSSSPIVDLTTIYPTYQMIVEETYNAQQIGEVVASPFPTSLVPLPNPQSVTGVVNNQTQFSASFDINRINFPPLAGRTAAQAGDFLGVPVWNTTGGTFGVTAGHFSIPFRAADLPAASLIRNVAFPGVADRIATAVNAAGIAGVLAIATGNEVTLDNPTGSITIPSAPQPLQAGGQGPGGEITGLASVGGGIYGISNRGGLYRINVNLDGNAANLRLNTTFIASSVDDLLGIDFTGLTAGPQSVENARYSNLLFATDRSGRLYAMNTQGVLQPIFVDGQTSVQLHINATGLNNYNSFDVVNGGVQGLAFSGLDSNLWQITPRTTGTVTTGATAMDVRVGAAGAVGQAIPVYYRGSDLGHGRYATTDTTRFGQLGPQASCLLRAPDEQFPECGLSSYMFGQGNVNGTPRTYDFAGGAKGSLITNEFSLKGYGAADQPTLYFTYFSANEDANSPDTNRDSFRVYVSGDDGQWVRVAHNDNGAGGTLVDNSNTWQQARVMLGAFAGRDNLRLRFDFSTAGDLNTGDIQTTGDELRAIPGDKLRDAQTFRIDNETFEFDLGYTLVMPSGGTIQDGETFTISDGFGTPATYEFDDNGILANANNVRVALDPRDPVTQGRRQTAADIARIVETLIRLNGPTRVVPHVADNRINLTGATSVTQTLAPGEPLQAVVLDGVPGVTPGNHVVSIFSTMTRSEVASAMDLAMEPVFHSQAIITSSGPNYDDGDSFQLSNGGTTVNFEFDSGYVITLPAAVSLSLNATSRDTVTLYDSAGRGVVFEFEKTGIPALAGHRPVPIQNGDTALTVANKLMAAILAAPESSQMGVIPTILSGGRLQLRANPDVILKYSSLLMSTIGAPGVGGSVQFQVPGALSIQVPTVGGAVISDGEQFAISDGVNNVIFELDNNGTTLVGRTPIVFSAAMTANQVVSAITTAISGSTLIGLNPVNRGNGLIDLGSSGRHSFTINRTTLDLRGRPGVIQEGEQFTINDGTSRVTFEMNSVGGVNIGNRPINFTPTDSPAVIAAAIANSITTSGLVNINPTVLPLGIVNLGETIAVSVNSAGLVNLLRTGAPGDAIVPVPFAPSSTVSGNAIATAVANAVNTTALNVTATVNAATQRRVTLTGTPLTLVVGLGSPPLSFEQANDIVKGVNAQQNQAGQRQDWLFHIIGHSVTNAGPLGLQTATVTGDINSDPEFFGTRRGYNDNRQGQNNQFEGIYIDDLVIGFAERGEMITGVGNNTGFVGPAVQPLGEVLVGPYQLEVRSSANYASSSGAPPVSLNRSFDTNDRLSQGITLVAQPGGSLYDGQSFQMNDGISSLTFEYDDQSIRPGQPGYGVRPGHVGVPFNPTDTDAQVAATIRNAINSVPVRSALRGVTAALSDGVDGVVFTGASTSNRVNIFGTVTLGQLQPQAQETNDTLATAIDTGIAGLTSPAYVTTGEIGDNSNFPLQRGLDVDLYRVFLNAGETLRVDIDADETGSNLDAVLAIFSATGSPLQFNDRAIAPGEVPTSDPYIQFTPSVGGTYFIGVSGNPGRAVTAPFNLYDPNIEGSGTDGSTGIYRLNVTFGAPGPSDVVAYNELGDQNRFRDQGQIIINGSTISNSSQFGIVATAGTRDANSNSPHAAPTQILRELNTQGLAPGAVLMNNLLVRNTSGGIHISGQANPNGQPVASVPFARVINNTIIGSATGATGTGILVDNNASPTLLNNVVTNSQTGISVDASSSTTVVGGTVFQGVATASQLIGTADSYVISLDATDPLFMDAARGNYYLKSGSRAIDSSIDTLQDRATLITVRNPLGIAPSPIQSPDRDLNGVLRVDDASASPPIGFGQNVFKDRGALDRADFSGPTTSLISPRDEIFIGAAPTGNGLRDLNGLEGSVQFPTTTLGDFAIQLVDGVEPADPVNGVGVDDLTVNKDKIFVLKNNELLQAGIDYSFSYDTTNNTIYLTPLAGVWEINKSYFVDLVNKDQLVFTAPNGNQLTDGQKFTVTDGVNKSVVFEFDSGYTLQVPATGVSDGQRFTITSGGNAVTFEFDRNNTLTNPSFIRIPFTQTSTQSNIADAIVTALASQPILGLAPQNIGTGKVQLGGTATPILNLTQSSLTVTGSPGVTTLGATPIYFTAGTLANDPTQPAMVDNQVANSIVNAISAAGFTNVRATTRIYTKQGVEIVEVVLRGAKTLTGFQSVFTSAILDLAGNDLKANNLSGSTSFSIFLGNGIDYGDAPTTYPVTGTGAGRHQIVTGYYLGTGVSAEADGQPSVASNLDNLDDGVAFNTSLARSGSTAFTITASAAGFLDAFVDFNRDGDWDDLGEKVILSQPLTAGANSLSFLVPSDVSLGDSYARFRFSSTGSLGPNGLANDGEIEDYKVTLVGPPWQNPTKPLDVNFDGHISAIDALIIINMLNKFGSNILLPNPPPFVSSTTPSETICPSGAAVNVDGTCPPQAVPKLGRFVDTNGDGFTSPLDALIVINELNLNGASEGEAPVATVNTAEGESSSELFVSMNVPVETSVDQALLPNVQATNGNLTATVLTSLPVTKAAEFSFELPDAMSVSMDHRLVVSTAVIGKSIEELAKSGDHKTSALDEILDDLVGSEEEPSDHDAFFTAFG